MSAAIKLSELPVGAAAMVRELSRSSPASLRLQEMGLIAGTPIVLVRTAPLGDPLEVKIRGYHLSLRRSEADHVFVDPVA